MGGTLHQAVAEVSGYNDHSWDNDKKRDEQYQPSHKIKIFEGSLLHQIVGETEVEVNSLHHQGIEKLAPPLHLNAVSEDGLIEAVSLPNQFVLGVQWHPEWFTDSDSTSRAIFSAFGNAAQLRGAPAS